MRKNSPTANGNFMENPNFRFGSIVLPEIWEEMTRASFGKY
jgi:hypothetical protein